MSCRQSALLDESPALIDEPLAGRAPGRVPLRTRGSNHVGMRQFNERGIVSCGNAAQTKEGDCDPSRKELALELESIDYLIRFDQDTPLEMIQAIKPDVLVKGADYAKEQVVGWDFVEGCGGRIALAPLVDGRSTSAVIERILEAYR